MTVDVKANGNYAVIAPQGYLNGAMGQEIDETCARLIREGARGLVLNFADVETMNTMGVASLVSILEKSASHEGLICFAQVGGANRQLLDVLDISRAVLIFDTVEQARAHLEEKL